MSYSEVTIEKEILVAPELAFTLGVVVSNTGVTSNSDGKKIIKAGTPIAGSLEARTTAWKVASTTDTANAVILHDTDVTSGNTNATMLVFGFVDVDKLDDSVITLLTETVKSDLSKITFISGRK